MTDLTDILLSGLHCYIQKLNNIKYVQYGSLIIPANLKEIIFEASIATEVF
jgi:hypothetical protein